MVTDTCEQTPHDRAMQRLKKPRDFRGHLLVYVLVNAFLVGIWAVTGAYRQRLGTVGAAMNSTACMLA